MPTISPFKEALAKHRSRVPVGADLSSSQWGDVPLALRDRAFFGVLVGFRELTDATTKRDGSPPAHRPRKWKSRDCFLVVGHDYSLYELLASCKPIG